MLYLVLKTIHILAVILFMGNIIIGIFWMHFAMKTNNQHLISHTMKGIIKADRYFTIPGVVVITASGIWSAITAGYPILGTGWILWSIIMFSLSGIAFAVKVAPVQQKIYKLSISPEMNTNAGKEKLRKLMTEWDIWGLVAVLAPLCSFVMMVFKFPQKIIVPQVLLPQ